ncbi:BTB/POZ domain-containing protein 18 [Oxyura jamaicensis]|uniref:BTB/POZ domain-containing protein 18 n=1 Tax=Oxyura jamaicensis TaxID=8884 RepID=UPI0015A5BF9D|nr:BTB/POZ domain-containing protein 18 [Oxyura jamaicensis]
MSPGSASSAAPRLLYRSTRLLHAAFLRLHQQQQREDVFCDVVLRAEGEAVAAHCCVLSVCSPFFMEQLARELPPQGRRVVLELQGLKIGALRKLVRFLYTAELEASSEEAQEVLAAARQLRVAELESLQLQGGCLVHPRPRWRLDRSCLRAPQPGSPRLCPTAGSGAEPGGAGSPHKGAPRPKPPVGRLKLRKVEGGEHWEVVREGQPSLGQAGKGTAVGAGGVAEPWPPPAACRKQSPETPGPQQGWGLEEPQGNGLGEEEEVDVGVAEPCLPPGAVCTWPSPSSESDGEVDVLG